MKIENYAGVFLRNNGKVLLIKRGLHKSIAPGKYSCIGGRIEQNEMNNPIEAAYREIFEESGIVRDSISGLWLGYIVISREHHTLYTTYIFFGETSQTEIIANDEGELFWIDEDKFANQDFSPSYTQLVAHYMQRDIDDFGIYVTVINESFGEFRISWFKMDERKRNS